MSNLLFLEINTKCSKTDFLPEKKQSRPVMLHVQVMQLGPGEGEEDLSQQGCQNFPLKSWPFTLPWPWEEPAAAHGEGREE